MTEPRTIEERLTTMLRERADATRVDPDAMAAVTARSVAGRSTSGARIGRRPLLVAGAVAASLALVVGVLLVGTGGGDTAPPATVPPGQPLVAGTLVGMVDTMPCNGDCIDGPAEIALNEGGDFRYVQTVQQDGRNTLAVLPDGFTIASADGGGGRYELRNRARETQRTVELGDRLAIDADRTRDGRLLFLTARDGSDTGEVVIVAADDSQRVVSLPDGLLPHAVALGLDGTWVALADRRECCLNRPVLVFSYADGTVKRTLDVDDALADVERASVTSEPDISTSVTGLVAISADRPDGLVAGGPLHPGWTVVVDPDTGGRVAHLDGWQGLAWANDGTGLVAARRTGERSSELALFTGPHLEQRAPLPGTPVPFVPLAWDTGR